MERQHQRGFILIAALVLIVMVAILAATITRLTAKQSRTNIASVNAIQAFYLADSALQIAYYALKQGTVCRTISGRKSFTRVPLAAGEITVTAKSYHPLPATLTQTVGRQATTLPLSSVKGYAKIGRVMIDDEWMRYNGVSESVKMCHHSPPCLLQVQRGLGGTAITAHSKGAHVQQQQCTLFAIAAVPSFAHPRAVQQLTQSVSTQRR
jgi:Tfp pilus assembly protein PilX